MHRLVIHQNISSVTTVPRFTPQQPSPITVPTPTPTTPVRITIVYNPRAFTGGNDESYNRPHSGIHHKLSEQMVVDQLTQLVDHMRIR